MVIIHKLKSNVLKNKKRMKTQKEVKLTLKYLNRKINYKTKWLD